MIAKFMRAGSLIAIIFLMSTPLVSAGDEKKPGFHGWGDSRATTAEKGAAEAQPKPAAKVQAPKKTAEKAAAGQPKTMAPSRDKAELPAEISAKIQGEREAFFEDTKSLRQEIYQKRLELRSELAKSDPSARRAQAIQKDIAQRRAEFDRKRLEHFLRLKKMDPDLGRRGFYGQGGFGNCPNCPYRDRGYRMMGPGYGRGRHMMGPGYGRGRHMMGPGYGRHHLWDEDDGWWSGQKDGGPGRSQKKAGPESSRATEGLSPSDARAIVADYLKSTRNPNLKLGGLSDAGDTYQAEILTKDGSLVDTVMVDKQSGHMRPAY